MFLKYYQNIFVPFIQSMFKKTRGVYWIIIVVFSTAISYWNVYSSEGPSLPVYIISILGLLMYCFYVFSFAMFFCKVDGLFDSLQQRVSVLTFNLFSAICPVLFFISYFIGLFMLNYIRTGVWLPTSNFWFVFPSCIIGLTISNYQFAKGIFNTNSVTNETSVNMMLLLAFIPTGLVVGVYFALYYFVTGSYFVIATFILYLVSLVSYIHSVKLANRCLELNVSA